MNIKNLLLNWIRYVQFKSLSRILFLFLIAGVLVGYTPFKSNTSKINTVWIFCGHPGDELGKEKFLNKIGDIKSKLMHQHQLQSNNIHIYFNKGEGANKTASKEQIDNAINDINTSLKKGNNGLVLFMGHANSTANDIQFNLPGSDMSIQALSESLNIKNTKGTLGVIWAVESGERAVKLLGGNNLVVLASTETEDRDNEPVLNEFLEDLFDKSKADESKDGVISFVEMHALAKRKVQKWYKEKGLVQLEKIILDGDGDGKGTSTPLPKDEEASKRLNL